MTSAHDVKIHISGVSKHFGDKVAVDDVTFDVPTGKKSVLIGPAASGKSVLMKCIAGVYQADAGTIKIDDQTVGLPGSSENTELMKNVGVVFQQGGLFDSLTVWENITFKLRYSFGMGADEAKQVAVANLAKVNLPAKTADLLPSQLSGGMQKRVGIARALAGDPSLLLLDEPTAGLDPITTSAINRLIDRSIKETGATVLSITSDMASVMKEYDHLFMLNEGGLVWQGPVSGVRDSGNPYVLQLTAGKAEGPIKMRIKARA